MSPLEIIGAVVVAAVVVIAFLWVAGVIDITVESDGGEKT